MHRHIEMSLVAVTMFVLPWQVVAQERAQRPGGETFAQSRELANPGPEHDMLSKFAGNWDVTVTAGNASGRTGSVGKCRSYMTLERRFLWIGYEARGESGRFKGAFMVGFDRRHQHFTMLAMDTDGTYFVTSKGKKLPDSQSIKLYGTDDDPYMKKLGFTKEFAHVLKFNAPNKFTIDILFIDTRTDERKEVKAIEFTFTRRIETKE